MGLAGCGYWGKNLARNLHQLGQLAVVCDADARVLKDTKSMTFVEGEAKNEDGTIVAKVIATVRVRHAKT